MKKVSILTFAICLSCVVLAGCSGENSSKTESASSQSSETTEAGETKMPDTTSYQAPLQTVTSLWMPMIPPKSSSGWMV